MCLPQSCSCLSCRRPGSSCTRSRRAVARQRVRTRRRHRRPRLRTVGAAPRPDARRLTPKRAAGQPFPMPTAKNGPVELYYETFGSAADPALLMVNGLGSQSINYDDEWCEMFAARGYFVIRFDNRDTGCSSKLDGIEYTLGD